MTLLPIVVVVAAQSTNIYSYFQPDLHDAVFTARVVKADQRELAKINSDFGASYRFKTTTIHLKEPFMLRMDARVEDTTLSYVINGTHELLSIPRARIKERTDLAFKPGRRQTLFDFGVLTSSLFDNFYEAHFVRVDRATGDPVFDILYVPSLDNKTRSRIWIDPKHRTIAKREWYAQDGHQQATFIYSDPIEDNGVWLPTQLEVKNIDDEVAGVTRYESIKVNEGVPESEFATR